MDADRQQASEMQVIQDEMLDVAHQLTCLQSRLHRLQERVYLDDGCEPMIEGTAPKSLEFEIHGVLDTAAEEVATAARALREGGLRTEDALRREFVSETLAAREPSRPAPPARTDVRLEN
jgi:hypothetical protein